MSMTITEAAKFNLSDWENRRNEKFYAESDSWHFMIGWLSAVVARGEAMTASQLETALLDCEAFGNERLERKGYEALTAAADCLRRQKEEEASA
jgi:hypothetical protein